MVGKHKLGIKVLMVTLGVLLILIPFAGCAPEVAEKDPVTFADRDYDSTQIHNRIAAFILENLASTANW